MPLLLGYAGDALRRRSCTFTLPLGRGDARLLHHAEKNWSHARDLRPALPITNRLHRCLCLHGKR